MSVYFHVNFNLNRERLAKILKFLVEQPKLNDLQIAEKFGFKAPFTARYKSWLKKCGILKNSTKVELTEYGKIIYQKDKGLILEPTLWYMHSSLCKSEENAEVWNFFYHSYLDKTTEFTKAKLSEAISMKLMPHDDKHFGKNAPMIKVITKVLLNSYLSETGFGPLGILEQKNDKFHYTGRKPTFKWENEKSFSTLF